MKTFIYELVNADHLSDAQIKEVEHALEIQAYVCQQDFEKMLDLGHQINVLPEADDEAFVNNIEADGDDIYVELDCSKVK